MEIEISKKFMKDVRNRDEICKAAAAKLIVELQQAEKLYDIRDCIPMEGTPDTYRVRRGDYRILFRYTDNKVILHRFLPRGDVYKHKK